MRVSVDVERSERSERSGGVRVEDGMMCVSVGDVYKDEWKEGECSCGEE